MYNLLELFKGTGSIGKVAHKMNMNIVSLDMIEKYKPNILIDILNWDYTNVSRVNISNNISFTCYSHRHFYRFCNLTYFICSTSFDWSSYPQGEATTIKKHSL